MSDDLMSREMLLMQLVKKDLYIEVLETNIRIMKHERDAAIAAIKECHNVQSIEDDHPVYDQAVCLSCAHYSPEMAEQCKDCEGAGHWKWRGPKEGDGDA